MVDQDLEEKIRRIAEKYAIINAAKHEGKAEVTAVISKVMGELKDYKPNPKHVYDIVKEEVERINSLQYEEILGMYSSIEYKIVPRKEEKSLPSLPNAEKGKVVLRLPPEPSGYMHIGHAMAFSLNYLYKQMYDGKLWLRFEDTNPKKVSLKYYENFRKGIRWLGIVYEYEKCVSEDLDEIYSYAYKLIEKGRAYVCSCSYEKVKAFRFEGKECEHRQNTVEKNLKLWEDMLSSKYNEGEYVLRFKGEMKSLDSSLRDPNLFRIIKREHPVTGTKYSVWPTYDFANVIEDHICKVTHVLRSSEFHTSLQNMMREILSLNKLEVIQFSRFNFKGTPVQKRMLRPLVESKLVSGWDDPRMPTIDGLIRRGILPDAIMRFTREVGYTKSEHEFDWSLLFAVNRKILDPLAKRLFFVKDPVKIRIENFRKNVRISFHPESELGDREISVDEYVYVSKEDLENIKEKEVFRLMDLCNVFLPSKDELSLKFVGNELKQEMKKIQWVPEQNCEIKVIIPSELFDEKGNFREDSLELIEGLAEGYFSNLSQGEIVQFVRFGFCRVDGDNTVVFCHK